MGVARKEVRFEIYFENLGTTTVENVQITDTLPEGLEFDNWGTNFWQPMNGGNYDPATRKITWTIEWLEPGWTSSINVRARVPVADRDKQGLIFENKRADHRATGRRDACRQQHHNDGLHRTRPLH